MVSVHPCSKTHSLLNEGHDKWHENVVEFRLRSRAAPAGSARLASHVLRRKYRHAVPQPRDPLGT